MLKKIRIKNFKSVDDIVVEFEKNNIIIGNNGVGKTNILQAISYLFGNTLQNENIKTLLKEGKNSFYIEGIFLDENMLENKLVYFFQENTKRLKILLNSKQTTKKVLFDKVLKVSYFSPLDMNLFYLGPKYRRDFLDNILVNIFSDFKILLKKYDMIQKSRNKVLKNIFDGKSKKTEVNFWDEEFKNISALIYKYRMDLNNFLEDKVKNFIDVFVEKNYSIEYKYITNVDLKNIKKSIGDYLKENLNRDIILKRTSIGPHRDDFSIVVNGKDISSFASRGEIKSIILKLKYIEIDFIRLKTNKNPILLIDDFVSELDEKHFQILLNSFEDMQIIYTSIIGTKNNNLKKILL